MNPSRGQYVKCLLKNSIIADGEVISWSDEKVELLSDHGKSILIINHPKDDIVLIKIILPVPEEQSTVSNNKSFMTPSELESQLQEVIQLPSQDELRITKIAELRKMMAEEDRQIIASKLRDHYLGPPKGVEYGYPGFFKK